MNWEYISGFFDADGSVSIASQQKGKNKTMQLSFHNNERNILESIQNFILEELGVKGHISLKKARQETHKDSYDLKYVYLNAVKVANSLKSLHPKKVHRIKVYNLIQEKTKRNGQYTDEELLERRELELEFFQI